ncbi:hypothetical protein BDZ91DRAFT_853802 [Kalaharituber pfeilii]|nr:hypothetical protein BDZ91DRAFT_853802 [Kalaharituber pfeilii]
MRFQNWDVLIFPANDATPIQEFTTEFCNIPDPDQAFLSRVTSEDPENPGKSESKSLPTVSTYIPMLSPGTPFQISIHSWTTPEVSSTLESGTQAMIEARLFIDGVPITYVVCPVNSGWPMVVDSYPITSTFGTRKRNLTFPAFNHDSLNQWANGDTELGRIKIVISEGVAGNAVDNGEVSYMRLKNLVCFYYRYAPQEFLESVGIYYPTTRKYDNSLARWFPISVPTHHQVGGAFGSPAHSHSPTRKPFIPAAAPPAFDLNSAIPSLEKTSFPDLQPAVASANLDPFSCGIENKKINISEIQKPEDGTCSGVSRMQQIVDSVGISPGHSMHSPCQTTGTGTPATDTITSARMRADSVSSLHSQQSTKSFQLVYTEQSSRKEDKADPMISKSMKIGMTTGSQKQMQAAHQGLVGEDNSIPGAKEMVTKADTGRNNTPLVELDNIL